LKVVRSNLRALAEKKGVSVRQIAKELPYRYESVRLLYNDESKQFPRDLLTKLCDYFDCSVSDLLVREESIVGERGEENNE